MRDSQGAQAYNNLVLSSLILPPKPAAEWGEQDTPPLEEARRACSSHQGWRAQERPGLQLHILEHLPLQGIISCLDKCGGSGVLWPGPTCHPLGLEPEPCPMRFP